MVTNDSLLQYANAPRPSVITPDGMVIEAMALTLLPMVADDNERQPLNAP
jgi:hypothetical protein